MILALPGDWGALGVALCLLFIFCEISLLNKPRPCW